MGVTEQVGNYDANAFTAARRRSQHQKGLPVRGEECVMGGVLSDEQRRVLFNPLLQIRGTVGRHGISFCWPIGPVAFGDRRETPWETGLERGVFDSLLGPPRQIAPTLGDAP
ncbi:hypothetical protein D3C85_1204410 [compost metagenome]